MPAETRPERKRARRSRKKQDDKNADAADENAPVNARELTVEERLVSQVLNTAQKNTSSHSQCIDRLVKHFDDEDGGTKCFKAMWPFLVQIFDAKKCRRKSPQFNRILLFIEELCRVGMRQSIESDEEEQSVADFGHTFTMQLLRSLLGGKPPSDFMQRARVCQVVGKVLNVASTEIDRPEDQEVLNKAERSLLSMMQDNKDAVRAEACRALKRLQFPMSEWEHEQSRLRMRGQRYQRESDLVNVPGMAVTEKMRQALDHDMSERVRLAAMQELAVTRVLAVVLFAGFGARLLYDGLHMDDGVSDELAEVEEELQAKGLVSDDYLGVASRADETKGLMSSRERRLSADGLEEDNEDFDLDLEALPDATSPSDTVASAAVSSASSSVLWQAATMTFLAEWGDRSQVTTVVMGSQYHLLGIIVGGLLGHALCTGLACIGGKLLASRISEKKVTLLGGALFLVFALHGAYELL
ncbi:MAG: hypothetical protein MHM6MM_001581 [Cercozoa sp. M6MM]